MMTKTTSKSRALLKKVAVLPVLAGLIFISCTKAAGQKSALTAQSTVLEVVQVAPQDAASQPEFPGGMEAFFKFVGKEFKIPAGYKGDGKIILTFVVTGDGTLEGIEIVKDGGFGTGDEAVRMMKKSPKWNPGLKDGKPVRVQYHLPIQLNVK